MGRCKKEKKKEKNKGCGLQPGLISAKCASYFKGACTVITCRLCGYGRICYVRRHFSRGGVHARMRSGSCNSIVHAAPRHATTSRILPSRYRFQIDVSATRNNAVRSRRTALRLCTAEGCVHPSSSTPSVVNNTDFAARPLPPAFPLSCQKCTSPGFSELGSRAVSSSSETAVQIGGSRSAYLPQRVKTRRCVLLDAQHQLSSAQLRIAGRPRAGKETDRAAVLSPRIGWRLATVSSGGARPARAACSTAGCFARRRRLGDVVCVCVCVQLCL